jgi:hypothetical protein
MRAVAMAVVAAFGVGAIGITSAADAAPRKKRIVQARVIQDQPGPGATTIISRDETGRTRTKILVQKRSYLDGGTEVMPGDNIDPYRSSFLRNRPAGVLDNTGFSRPSPLSDPFFLPGKNNPYPFSGN